MDNRNGKRMMAAAGRYAWCRFALNYCMYGDTLSERTEKAEGLERFQKQLHQLMGQFLEGTVEAAEIDALRSQIIQETEIVTAYTDRFQIYEYVMNRLEKRFQDSLPVYDDNQIVDEILGFIVSAQETALQNERIKQVLEQLPLRFTRAKFCALISQALSIYEGTEKKSLRQVIELLRAEALLSYPEGTEESYLELWKMVKKLGSADYRKITEEQFQELKDCLVLAEEKLSLLSSDCLTMIDLINDLYVITLTRKDTLMDSREEGVLTDILTLVYQGLDKGETIFQDELEERLVEMEGWQERYYEQWTRFDLPAPEEFPQDAEGAADYQLLRKIDLLLSTSSFMSLEEEEAAPEGDILLSRKAVEEECAPFLQELEESWKGMPKPVMRAIMARLLAVLPMFFTTSDEIREFVGGCLASCTDLPEKCASIELIHEIMENENAFV